MSIFELMEQFDHEQVVFCNDKSVGLKAIIAVHNTTLGPALGGTRMRVYKSEEDALLDALRLSRGMTYKAAVSGLNLGGGKAVIMGNPDTDKSEALFRSFGRFVESLSGRYITAEDSGTNVRDIEYIHMETNHVRGLSTSLGGSGDPSPVTALGVFCGMKACAKEKYGTDSLKDLTISIQGVGAVGQYLVDYILEEKPAKLYLTDVRKESVRIASEKCIANGVEVEILDPNTNDIYNKKGHIFAPCAFGQIINDETLKNFNYEIIAGAANNQLLDQTTHGKALREMNILYAPDYVINAGGVINVGNELLGYTRERAMEHTKSIYNSLLEIFKIAKDENITTDVASNRLAEKRMNQLAALKRFHLG